MQEGNSDGSTGGFGKLAWVGPVLVGSDSALPSIGNTTIFLTDFFW